MFVLLLTTAVCNAASWDYVYNCGVLPNLLPTNPPNPINYSAEVTHYLTDDTREIISNNYLHIIDSTRNRTRYRVDLSSLYGSGAEAGTMETRQKFVSSSDMSNVALMMRQDTANASAEIRAGYYDAGDGRRGLWNAKTGEFLGVIEANTFYKLRMVLDGAAGGRLYVNDSYYANLTPGPGGTSRLSFGAGSLLGTGEVYIDYVRWCHGYKNSPGMPGDPQDPDELLSPRITTLPAATPGVNSVTITWNTDAAADSTVRWGTKWDCPVTVYDSNRVTQHSVTINGLRPGSTYNFTVESRIPGYSNVAFSGIQSFTTQDGFRMNTGPFVRTTPDGKSATASWTTTFDGDSKLFYRLKGTLGWSQKSNTVGTASHALAATNLTAGSTYEYYVVSTRSGAPDTQSPIREFNTFAYSSASSLLVNGDFELGNLLGWTVLTGTDAGSAHQGPWFNSVMPHSANFFIGADSNDDARNSTIYQYIDNLTSGSNVYASVWVHTYELSPLGDEEHNSASCQVGLDVTQEPATGINPNASTISWSAPVYTANFGDWTCIGVVLPRGSSDHAVIFLRQMQTDDGGLNATGFDDAVITTTPPVNITAGPTIVQNNPTATTIEWTTDVDSSSFVQIGTGATGAGHFSDFYTDSTLTKNHQVTIRVYPATPYIYQVGSATPMGMTVAPEAAFISPMNETIENGSFEYDDNHANTTMLPWTIFQYNINNLPRIGQPGGQPAGGSIDGLMKGFPFGGPTWNGITCELNGGENFLGAFASNANENGGISQRIKVTPGQSYKAAMRFLTHQSPIDGTHPAGNTACAIAIDPTGGTDVRSSNLIWSSDLTSTTDGMWDDVSVRATAASDTITVFCIMEQRYADTIHLNAIDNITFQLDPATTGSLGKLKSQTDGTTVAVNSAILTYINVPTAQGEYARLYVEDTNRSSGVLILSKDSKLWTNPPHLGDKISATGTLSVDGGEIAITTPTVSVTSGSAEDIPDPVISTNKSLGGGSFGIQPGVLNGAGLTNVGIRVKIVGVVTSGAALNGWVTDGAGNTCTYVDDGSKLDSGVASNGVKIIASPSIATDKPLKPGDYISVVGICSTEKIGDIVRPVILVTDPTSVTVVKQAP